MRHRLLYPANKVRQGDIVLRSRVEKSIFLAGLAAPVVLALVLLLASA